MDWMRCEFLVAKQWPVGYQPLHLITDQVKWLTRFGENDSPVIIALNVKDVSHDFPPKPGFFCVLHLVHCPGNSTSCPDEMCSNQVPDLSFYCSEEFLKHYGQFFRETCSLHFACIHAFPLERVIFGAMNDEVYNWAKQQNFETGLLVSSTCTKSLLVRQDDCFLSSFHHMFGHDQDEVIDLFKNLVALECSPLKQGLLTTSTMVSIVRIEDKHKNSVAAPNHVPPYKLKARIDDSDLTTVNIFDFNSDSSRPSCTVYCSQTLAKSLGLESEEIAEVSLLNSPEASLEVEEMPTSALPQEENPYFQIETDYEATYQSNAIGRARPCFLKVVANEKYCSHIFNQVPSLRRGEICCQCLNAVTFSTDLWFNFHLDANATAVEADLCEVELRKASRQPCYAREVHMSLVTSPNYAQSGCFDKTLIKFLTQRRLLKVGDVVAIDVYADIDFYEAADAGNCRCLQVFYKVTSIDRSVDKSDCFFVDIEHTTLYQDGTVRSYIPCTLRTIHLPGLDCYIKKLRNIVRPYLRSTRHLDHACSLILSGSDGCGKSSIVGNVVQSLGMHLLEFDCHNLNGDTAGATEAKIKDAFRRASSCAPCALFLTSVDHLARNRDTGQPEARVCRSLAEFMDDLACPMSGDGNGTSFPVVVVATASDVTRVVSDVRSLFLHQVVVEAPTESERFFMTKGIARSLELSRDVDFRWIAKHTAGFVYGDMWEVFRRSLSAAHKRVLDKCAVGTKLSWREEQCVCLAGVVVTQADVTQAIERMQSDRADTIGVPKIPDVQWQDIGGLEDVKNHILDTIQLPLDHPELVGTGLKRSGVLLYGPPGTGKTLLAKAVASQCSLSFFSVKGPELINMYVGQSEENVRRVFQRARDAAPCVIFFDELDALAPNRGRSGDSGGVMDRVVSQFLAELDGMNEAGDADKQVFVIAASNRPDLIDPALLRPGRLEKLLYVGISESKSDRLKILQAQTRKLNLAPNVCLSDVIDRCPDNITGADFHALANEAAMNAVRRHILMLEASDVTNEESSCEVQQGDLLKAAASIVPSLSRDQLENYKRVRSQMTR